VKNPGDSEPLRSSVPVYSLNVSTNLLCIGYLDAQQRTCIQKLCLSRIPKAPEAPLYEAILTWQAVSLGLAISVTFRALYGRTQHCSKSKVPLGAANNPRAQEREKKKDKRTNPSRQET
jgi:hypothetical protein